MERDARSQREALQGRLRGARPARLLFLVIVVGDRAASRRRRSSGLPGTVGVQAKSARRDLGRRGRLLGP
eukprot:3718971-Prymnesium_polylepis.1